MSHSFGSWGDHVIKQFQFRRRRWPSTRSSTPPSVPGTCQPSWASRSSSPASSPTSGTSRWVIRSWNLGSNPSKKMWRCKVYLQFDWHFTFWYDWKCFIVIVDSHLNSSNSKWRELNPELLVVKLPCFHYIVSPILFKYICVFFSLPEPGGKLGIFWFSFIFSTFRSPHDHSATAPPSSANVKCGWSLILSRVLVAFYCCSYRRGKK